MNDLAYLLTTVLQGVDGACGARFVWHGRHEFMNNATTHAGPVILATTDEPSAEESAYISSVSDTQQTVVLHLADELLRTTDPHIWGPGVQQVFRQYWAPHLGLGDAAISYLTDAGVKRPPAVAWMPLGIARLRPLSSAFSLALLDRTHLWSWIGSTEGKPERIEMLEALDAHSRAADIKAMGFLRPFQYFAGGWGTGGAVALGGPDAMGALEYTLLMHQTQFVPAPAGNSPEQFRIWEAFEAGDGQATTWHACHAAWLRPWPLIIGRNCSPGTLLWSGLWEPVALGLSMLALGRLPAHLAGTAHGGGWSALPAEGAGL